MVISKTMRLFLGVISFIYVCNFSMILFGQAKVPPKIAPTEEFLKARRNAVDWQNAMNRCHANTQAWLDYVDPVSGLFPDNVRTTWYTPHNAAADNYPFMMLTSFFTDENLFHGYMMEFMEKEKQLTSSSNGLPRNYNIQSREFGPPSIFGASEYAKDGLVPATELMGRSPWFDRMEELARAVMRNASIESDFGMLPDSSSEVNGEMLQVLLRLFSATGDRQYLSWAERIGDAYCREVMPANFGLPAYKWNFQTHTGQPLFNLRDHGCEILSGLSLLYAVMKTIDPQKAETYYRPVKGMLERVLQLGMNPDGLFVNMINCETGETVSRRGGWSDCFGYDYDGFYTFYLSTGERKYRDCVEHVLRNIHKYRGYPWEGHSHDGYADAIEGVLNLLNRIPVESAFDWVESETGIMFSMQKPEGYIEQWHGDGNFSRTALMYALYKSKGVYAKPWRKDLKVGAVRKGGDLFVYCSGDREWSGEIYFDHPRHKTIWKFDKNYPRINEFPEWYTFEERENYNIYDFVNNSCTSFTGKELVEGIPGSFEKGGFVYWRISRE